VKARKVKRLDPAGPVADNAERIVRVRLDELFSFAPRALEGEVEALHDMRIAAKRLRYVLEVTAFCFGSYASTATKRARELQDVLGEIHDCDLMIPRVLEQIESLRAVDAAELRRRGGEAADLDPALAGEAPNRTAYRGLETLAAWLRARRELLFGRFGQHWAALERQELRARLERALDERAPSPPTTPTPGSGTAETTGPPGGDGTTRLGWPQDVKAGRGGNPPPS